MKKEVDYKHLDQIKKFLDNLTNDDLKNLRNFLPDELYELVFKLVPRLCVDIVIVNKHNDSVVLVTRDIGANVGMWNIPGGWIKYNERIEKAIVRKAKQETGLNIEIDKTLPNGIIKLYDDPDIDKIGWTRKVGFQAFNPKAFTNSISITYLARSVGGSLFKDNKREARFFKMNENELPEIIPYHHKQVIDDTKKLLNKRL